MKRALPIFLAAALGAPFLALSIAARADVPPYVPVQGYLADENDVPLSGELEIRFRLYAVEDPSSTPLHEETQQVRVDKGHFTVYLGDATALAPAIFRDNTRLFLGIKVADDAEMDPLLTVATAPFAGYAQYCGEALRVQGLERTDIQRRVASGCPSGSSITAIDADGNVMCAVIPAPGVTSVTAGTGLSGGGGPGAVTLSLDTTSLQARVDGTCSATQAIRAIAEDGTVNCVALPQGTITGVTAGTGLTGGGTTGNVTLNVNPGAFHAQPVRSYVVTQLDVTSPDWTTVHSATITVPRAGTVLVLGTGYFHCGSCLSPSDNAAHYVGVTAAAAGTPASQQYVFTSTNMGYVPFTVHDTFAVGAGTHTFYMRGRRVSGPSTIAARNNLNLVFIPH